jgi:hypothetical protein
MSQPYLDDRYELLDEMPYVTGGRLYRARDMVFGDVVGVKQLGPNCSLDAAQREQLENTIRHLQSLPHPNIVRMDRFDALHGLLVQEWVQGISLLDLLRRRRELGLAEALTLLGRLPATLDFMAREAVPIPRPLLGKLYVELSPNLAPETVAATSVDRWPGFCLKLNPLSLREALGGTATDETTNTVVVDPRQASEIQEGYGPREFALLLYELLGGRIREVDTRRYVPLGVLGEAGNAVLRRELMAMPHADCESLWREVLDSQGGGPRSVRPLDQPAETTRCPDQIPAEFISVAQLGRALRLEAVEADVLSIYVTARPRFSVGRSASMADFVARVLPENEANNTRTNRLSRVHALLELENGQVTVRDGNGTGPSMNGSFLDGQALTPNRPAVLPQRARLVLGEEFAMDLIPVAKPGPVEISNLALWTGPAEKASAAPWAALVCEPVEGHALSRNGVWLFTEAGFGLDAAGRVIWDTRGRGMSPASFLYYRGCFWLRNHALSQPILIGSDTALGWGEVLPLASGQTIRLGAHDYSVHVE